EARYDDISMKDSDLKMKGTFFFSLYSFQILGTSRSSTGVYGTAKSETPYRFQVEFTINCATLMPRFFKETASLQDSVGGRLCHAPHVFESTFDPLYLRLKSSDPLAAKDTISINRPFCPFRHRTMISGFQSIACSERPWV
ncbi:hypothetical protein PoB_002533300, partial [Plakobranchus ocellatus]